MIFCQAISFLVLNFELKNNYQKFSQSIIIIYLSSNRKKIKNGIELNMKSLCYFNKFALFHSIFGYKSLYLVY